MRNDMFELLINKWGIDKSIYVVAWSIIGLGAGCIIGFLTKDAAIKNSDDILDFDQRRRNIC